MEEDNTLACREVDRRGFLVATGGLLGAMSLSGSAGAVSDDIELDTYFVGPAEAKPPVDEVATGTLYYETDTEYIRYSDGSAWATVTLAADAVTYNAGSAGAVDRTASGKFREVVSAVDFGAAGDGETDDSAAIQAALDSLGEGGGTVILNGANEFLVSDSITVPPGCALVGDIVLPEWRTGNGGSMLDKNGSQIRLDPEASIKLRESASLKAVTVLREDIQFPVTAAELQLFDGTAVEILPHAHGTYIGHCLIAGFDQAIRNDPDEGSQRVRCEYLQIDCTNGIRIDQCYDISYIRNVHAWPFTTQAPGVLPTDRVNRRHGTAFMYNNVADWCKFTNCFSYGYTRGFRFVDVNSCTAIGCGVDYSPGQTDPGEYAIGFEVAGSSMETTFIGCQSAAVHTGFLFDMDAPIITAKMSDCTVWEAQDQSVEIRGGQVTVDSCKFRTDLQLTDYGVTLDGGEDHKIRNCSFHGLTVHAINSTSDSIPFHHDGNIFKGIDGEPVHNNYYPEVDAAPVLQIDANYGSWLVTGTEPIADVAAGWDDRFVQLQFVDSATVKDSEWIELDGIADFEATPGSTLTLVHRDDVWYEVSRSKPAEATTVPTIAASRDDDGAVFIGGQPNRVELAVEASTPLTVRDRVPANWTVDDGDPHDLYEVQGERYIEFTRSIKDDTVTYLTTAPSDVTETDLYTFGPIEVKYDDDWETIERTSTNNAVIGQDASL